MAAIKPVTLAIRTIAKPISAQLKNQAKQHETFRNVCISLAQRMHTAEISLRTNILGESARHNIQPLSETKAIENGANALAGSFVFAVAATLILGAYYRSSSKQSDRRDNVDEKLESLLSAVERLQGGRAEVEGGFEKTSQELKSEQKRREAPFFETVKSFADVPNTEDGIDTRAFLEAADGVVRLFKLLESPAFAPVVNDLNGNIIKVRTRYLAHPDKSATLELLTLNEQSESKRPATEGLMWLLRGLLFTHQALYTAQKQPDIELAQAFTKGYDASLKRYHNLIVQGIFSIAMNACPCRKDFYAKLAMDPIGGMSAPSDKVHEALDKWLEGLDRTVVQMQKVYKEKGYGQI